MDSTVPSNNVCLICNKKLRLTAIMCKCNNYPLSHIGVLPTVFGMLGLELAFSFDVLIQCAKALSVL